MDVGSLLMAKAKKRGASMYHQRQRRLLPKMKIFKVLLFVLSLGGLGFWLSGPLEPGSYPINSVRIVSPIEYVSQNALKRVIEPLIGEGFFRIDVEHISAMIEVLPWVHRAAVRRVWPGQLVVNIEEQQPFSIWNDDALVNIDGIVFRPEQIDDSLAALPHFVGPEGTAKMMTEHFREFNDNVVLRDINIVRVDLSNRRAWQLELDNGLILNMGRNAVVKRLQRFAGVYAIDVKPRLAQIDG
ncbi:MAG TPA: FtsQ-type POTRA domain-containing protein, partial [Ectothiorhodospiraceae bacterium]|nr:FtsQ-type POTRA domain-containing protein [Ectothiorhodospiraceae bacterium]